MLQVMIIVFAIGLAAAAYSDYRQRRIPNYITLPMMALGLVVNAVFPNGLGLEKALLGFCFGGGIFMVLYVFRMMGAGDVKLAAAVGAWLGMPQILIAIFYIIMAGGVMAIGQILMMKLRPHTIIAVQQAVVLAGDQKIKGGVAAHLPKATLPYGVAIAAGTLISLLRNF